MSTEETVALEIASDVTAPVVRGTTPNRRWTAWPKWVFLALLSAYFVVPLLAMARFAFQNVPMALWSPSKAFSAWSLNGLVTAVTDPQVIAAARTSLYLVILATALNLVLLVPLSVVVEVSAPHLRPFMTAITLLPWVIPPIALVVGVAGTFRQTVPWLLASPMSLVPFYALWAMPFTYRALDSGLRAIHARTLVEAARGLGASMPMVVFRVLLPNLRPSMIAASGLTAAMVLGEFAFASLLLKSTLPTQMVVYQRSDPRGGLALALFVMVVSAGAIAVMVHTLRKRGLSIQASGM